MEDKILLSDLLGDCLEFSKDPTPENEKLINDKVAHLRIIDYLPIRAKTLAVLHILDFISPKELNAVEAELCLTVAKAIYGVLSYAINLENDLAMGAFTPETVDFLYEFGIIDRILEYSGKDYQRLEKMVDEACNFSNIFKITEVAAFMSPENMEEFAKTLKDITDELTPEKLSALKELAVSGSPEWEALRQTFSEGILDGVMTDSITELADSVDKMIEENKKEIEKVQKEEIKEA